MTDINDDLALRIHDAVARVAGVVDVGSGLRDQILTYVPGGTIAGVVIDDAAVTVEIVASYPPAGSYVELAGEVRECVRKLAPNRAIDVTVCDIRKEA